MIRKEKVAEILLQHVQAILWLDPRVLCDQAVRRGRHLKDDNIGRLADRRVVDEAVHQVVLQRGVVSLVVDDKEKRLLLVQDPLLQVVHLVCFAAFPGVFVVSLGCVSDNVLLHFTTGYIRLNVLEELC